MAVQVETGVRGCWDCLTLSANGSGDLDPATVERVTAGLSAYGPGAAFHADTDPDTGEMIDTGFTWQPCQVCGMALGHDYVSGAVTWNGGR